MEVMTITIPVNTANSVINTLLSLFVFSTSSVFISFTIASFLLCDLVELFGFLSSSNSGYGKTILGSLARESSRQVLKSSFILLASAYLFLGFLAVALIIIFSTL